MIKGNEVYYAMLLAGAVIGIVVFFINFKKDWAALGIFAAALPAALLLAFVTAYLLHTELRGLPFSELLNRLGREYYFTAVYFSAFAAAFFFILGLKLSRVNTAAPSLAVFSCIARIGCIYTGCCGGIYGVPTAWLELVFGAAAFVWLQIQTSRRRSRSTGGGLFFRKHALLTYIAAYSAFRLVTEFFRAEPAPYYAVQILAAVVLLVFAAKIIFEKIILEKRRTKAA